MKILKFTPFIVGIAMLSCGEKKAENNSEAETAIEVKHKEAIQELEGITKDVINIREGIEESLITIDELLNEF